MIESGRNTVRYRGNAGLLAGVLGCVFGVLGIFTFGIIFVPLAALCALIGCVRGLAGGSMSGFGASLLAGLLAFVGFTVSPSLWLLTGGLLLAAQIPSSNQPVQVAQSNVTEKSTNEAPKIISGSHGSCQSLELAGKPTACSHAKGVVYMFLRNGVATLSLGISDTTAVTFVGDRTSQPSKQAYFLYLSHIDIYVSSHITKIQVGGECKLTLSEDSTIWKELICSSQDANGASYSLSFIFFNTPATTRRF
jgi:hypothetical protein